MSLWSQRDGWESLQSFIYRHLIKLAYKGLVCTPAVLPVWRESGELGTTGDLGLTTPEKKQTIHEPRKTPEKNNMSPDCTRVQFTQFQLIGL